MEHQLILTVGIAIGMVGSVLLHVLPHHCTCAQCSLHVREREDRAERKRAANHRNAHSYLNIPWGDPDCQRCKDGGDRDRNVR